ncbi:hypothetical protein LWI29_030862 [Acer saccharum]|uniref:Uncharacterized protein n=1 Tax=Acer saccharum TaxID=4024 RepID=A0AA39TTA4_ACESA|nr:hypothetical protein LWI29_030862 [Acer saccharum]
MGFSMAAVDGGGLAAENFGGGNWRVTAGMGFSMAAVDGGGLAAENFGGGNWRVTAGMGFSMAAVDGGGLAAEKFGGGNWRVTADTGSGRGVLRFSFVFSGHHVRWRSKNGREEEHPDDATLLPELDKVLVRGIAHGGDVLAVLILYRCVPLSVCNKDLLADENDLEIAVYTLDSL